jgi:hypothetical protein
LWFLSPTFASYGGRLPSPDELSSYAAARTDKHGPGNHWSNYVGRWPRAIGARKDLALVEFCQHFKSIELWFDPNPNEQLKLVWLLDYFRSHPETAARLKLRLVDFDLISASSEELGRWQVPAVHVTKHELETASVAWQAYRATTPEACFPIAWQEFECLAAAQARPERSTERASVRFDGAWRHRDADAGAD